MVAEDSFSFGGKRSKIWCVQNVVTHVVAMWLCDKHSLSHPCTLVTAAEAQHRQHPIALHRATHRPSQLRQPMKHWSKLNTVNGVFRKRVSWLAFSPTTRQRQGMGLTLNRPSGLKLPLIWVYYILMSHSVQLSAQANGEGCSINLHSDLLIVIW